MLESARNCSKYLLLGSKIARNIYCLAWLGSNFLENELLENARLEFYFPCSKSPSVNSATALILLKIKTKEYEETFTRMQG